MKDFDEQKFDEMADKIKNILISERMAMGISVLGFVTQALLRQAQPGVPKYYIDTLKNSLESSDNYEKNEGAKL